MIKRYYFYKLIIGIFRTLCPDRLSEYKIGDTRAGAAYATPYSIYKIY